MDCVSHKNIFTTVFFLQAMHGICMLYTFYPSIFVKKLAAIAVFCGALVIPLLTLVAVYGRIAWFLARQITPNVGKNPNGPHLANPGSEMRNKNFEMAKRSTIKTLLWVALCYIICWTGNQVWLLLFNLGMEMNWNSPLYQTTVFMICVNCVINPFIYLVQYRDYQNQLKKVFCCKKTPRGDLQNSASMNTVVSNMDAV